MGESMTVNSEQRVKYMQKLVADNFEKHRFTTYDIRHGEDRSLYQNRMVMEILKRGLKARGDCSFEELRAECKLMLGVPILRRDSASFMEQYDKVLKWLSYEDKIKFFIETDFPVTRLMKTKQMTEYINLLFEKFRKEGAKVDDLQDAA